MDEWIYRLLMNQLCRGESGCIHVDERLSDIHHHYGCNHPIEMKNGRVIYFKIGKKLCNRFGSLKNVKYITNPRAAYMDSAIAAPNTLYLALLY